MASSQNVTLLRAHKGPTQYTRNNQAAKYRRQKVGELPSGVPHTWIQARKRLRTKVQPELHSETLSQKETSGPYFSSRTFVSCACDHAPDL